MWRGQRYRNTALTRLLDKTPQDCIALQLGLIASSASCGCNRFTILSLQCFAIAIAQSGAVEFACQAHFPACHICGTTCPFLWSRPDCGAVLDQVHEWLHYQSLCYLMIAVVGLGSHTACSVVNQCKQRALCRRKARMATRQPRRRFCLQVVFNLLARGTREIIREFLCEPV